MNIKLPSNVTRTFHKVGFKFKQHSPEILVGAGVVGVVASGVLACRATLKVNAVLDESKKNIEKIHEATEKGATAIGEEYTVEDSKKDLTILYTQTGVKLFKLYAPAVGLGALSIGAIVGGHSILHKRNLALAAAYTAVDKSFKEYRERVVERFGEALDKELKYNLKTKEVEEVVANEDGSEQVVTKTIQAMDGTADITDPFSRVFDDGCTGWDPNPDFSKMFLIQQQNYANEKLKAQGYLFLNDVYEMLGFQRTPEGQTHGWIYDEKNPIGDNFVDFGFADIHKTKTRDFLNGYERVIILEFNHDGYILNKM